MSAEEARVVTDRQLDRLVDGELTAAEYREVLAACEQTPDGWRRCALAFLEAQAWQREFMGVATERKGTEPVAAVASRSSAWWGDRRVWLACATSFLVAFGGATAWRQFAEPGENPVQMTLDLHGHESGTGIEAGGKSQFAAADQARPSDPLGTYQVTWDEGQGVEKVVELPVFAADDPRAGMLLDEQVTAPTELVRALQRRGHQVQRQRNWIPVPTPTGNSFLVPVEELQITPVSQRDFH